MSFTIVGSYFAPISNFKDVYREISVIDDYGNLDIMSWRSMCRRIANDGAGATRVVPFWSIREADSVWMPYLYVNGSYDLISFNRRYFDNLRRLAVTANEYGLLLIFSLYDHCHTKLRNGLTPFNPWCNNRQGLRKEFYGRDADYYRESWEREVFDTLSGLRVQYEICNEPGGDCYRFILETLSRLEQRGTPLDEVISGIEYRLDQNGAYEDFMRYADRVRGELYAGQLEKTWIIPVHRCGTDDFARLGAGEADGLRLFLSDDGNQPKHSQEWFYRNYSQYFRKCGVKGARDRYYIECMFKTPDDDFSAVRGVSRALIEQMGIVPPNWDRYPEIHVDKEKLRLDRFHNRGFRKTFKKITGAFTRLLKRDRRH